MVWFRMFIERWKDAQETGDHRRPKKQCPFSCPSWHLRSCDTDYSVEEHLIRTLHCWHLTFAESLLDHCWTVAESLLNHCWPSVNLCLSPCHTSHISAEGWWFDHCGFRFLRRISDYRHQFRYSVMTSFWKKKNENLAGKCMWRSVMLLGFEGLPRWIWQILHNYLPQLSFMIDRGLRIQTVNIFKQIKNLEMGHIPPIPPSRFGYFVKHLRIAMANTAVLRRVGIPGCGHPNHGTAEEWDPPDVTSGFGKTAKTNQTHILHYTSLYYHASWPTRSENTCLWNADPEYGRFFLQ